MEEGEGEINLDKICRTCLSEAEDLRSVFVRDGETGQACVCYMVTSCTQLKFKEGDGLPIHICCKCLQTASMAFSFKLQAERADAQLRSYLSRKLNNASIKLEDCKDEMQADSVIKTEDKAVDFEYDSTGDEDQFDRTEEGDSDEDVKPLKDLKYVSPKKLVNGAQKVDKKCELCDKSFVSAELLEIHKEKAHELCSRCNLCLKVFSKKILMIRHKMDVHKISSVTLSEEERVLYFSEQTVCKFCNMSFDREEQLVSHIALTHNGHKKRGRPSKKDILRNKKRLKKILESMNIKSYDNAEFIVKSHAGFYESISDSRMENSEEATEFAETYEYSCSFCAKNFTSLSSYDVHLRSHLGIKNCICRICDKNFDSVGKTKEHLRTHVDRDSFVSANVKKNLSILENHKKMEGKKTEDESEESLVEIIIEDIKNEDFDLYFKEVKADADQDVIMDDEFSPNDLVDEKANIFIPKTKLYTKMYKMKKSHTCNVCKQMFSKTSHLMRHVEENHEGYEFPEKCDLCQKAFPNKSSLLRHKKAHKATEDDDNPVKPYSCDTCDMKFTYEMTLNKHILTQHKGKTVSVNFVDPVFQQKEKTFMCPNCSKTFYRQEQLEKHKKVHLPTEKKFECPICQKKFNRKDNLRSHSRVHEANKDDLDSNCLCVYCGHSFSNSSNLIVHMRRHTGEKPYKCDICGKAFPRSSDLRCHRRTHTGEKPCLCTICGKGFSRSNKLVRHMRIHTGQRPYKCMYCERAFTQSNDLTLHVRRHTGDKPYVCGVCGERFIQGTALQAHRRAQGHYEPNNPSPPAVNSVNNPNRLNANKVPLLETAIKVEAEPLTSTCTSGVSTVTNTTSALKTSGKTTLAQSLTNSVTSLLANSTMLQNFEVANTIPIFSLAQYNQSYH